MKNVVTKCLLVLIMLLLSGCAREPDPVVPTEQGGSCRDSIELSTGFYYRNGNLLMRQEPGELAFSPLCADPACTHDGPDCAAWFENPGSALSDLGWFHDRIWLVVKEQNTNKDLKTARKNKINEQLLDFMAKMFIKCVHFES